MNITPQCISCIFNQAHRVTQELHLDDAQAKEVLDLASSFVPKFSLEQNPPQNATMMYEAIAKLLNKSDIYQEVKAASTQEAQKLAPFALSLLNQSENLFVDATKIAVAGNVIDLASQVRFDLEEEITKVLHTPFAIDDSSKLLASLQKAKSVVYLADNAGEHIFDKLYMEVLQKLFPQMAIYYFTRGNPIINDVTYQEAIEAGIGEVATVINSGVRTPCIIVEDLVGQAKELFESADTIISKGMGNYECLNGEADYPIFFLLKVKCSVVAQAIGEPIGSIVCKEV
ncbi:MAG: DUF89 family protein [Campylobacterales bacterium]|nr:DUF89 family protein [Campylobacterales bacterium]